MRDMTICAKCKHFLGKERGTPREDIWYNHFCTASPRKVEIDPVTGKERYYAVNDLGQEYYTHEKYMFCRDVNKGNCPKFEPLN